MQRVGRALERAARENCPVLLYGETGTGKELAARAIHGLGPRVSEPFVAVNCAAIPGDLLESQLFGHLKGAFTGAVRANPGAFRGAGAGTVLLDEIHAMPSGAQAKLLRAIESRRVTPVGDFRELPFDARIVTACNTFPTKALAAGQLREDLYFRLSDFEIYLPPLRDRKEDIPLLVERLLSHMLPEQATRVPDVAGDVLEALAAHAWPGNIRELRKLLRQVISKHGNLQIIELRHLPSSFKLSPATPNTGSADAASFLPLREVERRHVEEALRASGNNRSLAAKLLAIPRSRLYGLIRRHKLQRIKHL